MITQETQSVASAKIARAHDDPAWSLMAVLRTALVTENAVIVRANGDRTFAVREATVLARFNALQADARLGSSAHAERAAYSSGLNAAIANGAIEVLDYYGVRYLAAINRHESAKAS